MRVSRDGERARLDVTDTGVGMTPEVAAHVFERFYQADPSRSSASGGAGLGLSLVKWIVDRHHGTHRCQEPAQARLDIQRDAARAGCGGQAPTAILTRN